MYLIEHKSEMVAGFHGMDQLVIAESVKAYLDNPQYSGHLDENGLLAVGAFIELAEGAEEIAYHDDEGIEWNQFILGTEFVKTLHAIVVNNRQDIQDPEVREYAGYMADELSFDFDRIQQGREVRRQARLLQRRNLIPITEPQNRKQRRQAEKRARKQGGFVLTRA